MSTNERTQVALFIDWDNLAISTAADLGGAIPDVKAVVQRAQQYGTVVIAKAYAEWQASSERLAVYRAGIEPVYAPTFRFEPDTATQAGKGKSLADPCMVADCIDALHLFPDVGTYVIVTGDKDMIPVVRLAQLRGRRVVVIGPDYVAGVLRDMADEFIPYRSLVESAAARPATEPPRRHVAHVAGEEFARRRTPERHTPTYVRQLGIPPVPAAPPAAPPLPASVLPVRPLTAPEITVTVPEPVEERPQTDDLPAVFAKIVEILQHRAAEGRERTRATNLKDALMQRMPGFSERRYGFSKFKDLLIAAEKSGVIQVIVAGPVHWVSLPGAPEPAPAPSAEPTALTIPTPVDQAPVIDVTPEQLEERRTEMIKFIDELRDRSRWLTYTYVLTNLISHFSRALPQSAAESQARATLNYLVQQGILRVDKEPQEVEVGGARHRVRMCHLNTDHELVIAALGPARLAGGPAGGPEVGAPEAEPTISTEGELPEAAGIRFEPSEGAEYRPSEDLAPREGDRFATVVAGNGSVSELTVTTEPDDAAAESPRVDEEPSIEGTTALPAPAEGAVTDQSALPDHAPATLEQAFGTLEQVVRRVTSANKPMISASTLRTHLVAALGSFNERSLGFTRFKDFLLAAADAGIIRLVTRGHVTLVAAPNGRSHEPAENLGSEGQ